MSVVNLWSRFIASRVRQRVFIMPTWYFLLFNTLVLGLLVYGYVDRSVIVISSGFMVVFVELLSMIEAHVNVRDLVIDHAETLVFEAGQEGVIELRIGPISRYFGVRFYALPPAQVSVNRVKSANATLFWRNRSASRSDVIRREVAAALFFWINDAMPGESAEVSATADVKEIPLKFTVVRRGMYDLPRIVSVSLFPFGLFRVWREFRLDGTFAAYPRPVGAGFLTTMVQKQNSASVAGVSPRSNQESEYLHHKLFSQGDSLRRVDWKASSRRGAKIVKVFSQDVFADSRVLRWEDTDSSDQELKLSQLALWVLEAHQDRIPFSLEIPGASTMIAAGERHKAHCLRLLAAFERTATVRAGVT